MHAGLLSLAVVCTLASACGGSRVRIRTAEGVGPTLAEVDDGVWALERTPEPTFFVDGRYWRRSPAGWSSTPRLGESFVPATPGSVPPELVAIRRPYRYSEYIAPRGSATKPVPAADLRTQGRPFYNDVHGAAAKPSGEPPYYGAADEPYPSPSNGPRNADQRAD